jgi:pilus assembly protein Flp/PilA
LTRKYGKGIKEKISICRNHHKGVFSLHSLSSKKKGQKGQGLVEYALILVLVAIVVIATLVILGPKIGNILSTINSSIASGSGVPVSGGGTGGGSAAPTAIPTCGYIGSSAPHMTQSMCDGWASGYPGCKGNYDSSLQTCTFVQQQ